LEYGFLTVRHRPHAPAPARFPGELPKAQPSASINPASIRSRQSEETNRGQSSASAVSPPRQSHSGLPRAGFMTFRIWFCLTNPKSWQATAISSCRETISCSCQLGLESVFHWWHRFGAGGPPRGRVGAGTLGHYCGSGDARSRSAVYWRRVHARRRETPKPAA
jgi:hypothetical protein